MRTVHDPVHFSDLKRMALSPAHFKASVESVFEATRAMRIGTIVHHIVLGPHRTKPLVLFEGEDRRGNLWKDFAAANSHAEIVTLKEWADAKVIADAVIRDPVAADLLRGCRREVSLKWEDAGIQCETDGIDFVGDGYIGDLKVTTCTEPAAFSRHAVKLLYHCQLPWLETGAKANGIATDKGLFLVGAEDSEPHCVTVLKLTQPLIDQGRKSCAIWLEKFRAHRDADHWPGYVQSVVDFEVPPWMGEEHE